MSRQPYRFRTWLRRHAPAAIAAKIPKGRDCGEGRHEWHLLEDGVWGCYHCEQLAHENPFPPLTWARYRAAALLMAAAEILEGDYGDDEALSLSRELMSEAGSVLWLGEDPPKAGHSFRFLP